MRKLISIRRAVVAGAVVALLAGAAALVSAPKPAFNKHQKAFYADQALVAFVRPGLVVTIKSAKIADDGTIIADFTVTDPNGLPLDRMGVFTPGPVSTSFIAAFLPKGQEQYTAYTTRVQKSPITNVSATQAGTDSGGTYAQVADGEYTYTFHTKAPSTIDRTATHSIGVYSSRDLSEFDLPTSYADNVYTFVPNGSAVKDTRDVVKTVACNKCHDPLSAHGGARQSVELCVLCHTPQTTDPDTGNTVDFRVMVHKIHMGSSLPSVLAGGTYQIIGYQQSVNDFSTVVFPADVRRCEVCHDQNLGAAQATMYLTDPRRDSCGSCHDNINFATGANHSKDQLPEISDNQCANCHTPQGELEFDASIKGAHTIPEFSSMLPGVVFNITNVTNTGPGQNPTVTFTITDKAGNPIQPSDFEYLEANLGGPTIDYALYASEFAGGATGSAGAYSYTFDAKIPADAKGTFAVSVDGIHNVKLLPGTTKEMTVADQGVNPVYYFGVTDSRPVPRRTVVSQDKCQNCHVQLGAHSGFRNRVENCVICHNPNADDSTFRPVNQQPTESIHFKTMIHKIHRAENLTTDFTVIGFQGSVVNFNGVRFPGDLRNCSECHVNNSEQLPLPDGLLASVQPRGWFSPQLPTAAACLACHTDKSPASHALAMTTSLGESCESCHSPDADFSIDKVHAR